jgi:hypothetical protein
VQQVRQVRQAVLDGRHLPEGVDVVRDTSNTPNPGASAIFTRRGIRAVSHFPCRSSHKLCPSRSRRAGSAAVALRR